MRTAPEDSPGPRRAIALLREAPDRVELLLRWCPEKEAVKGASKAPAGPETIRSVVARLGTLDRHHYLESVRKLAADGELPELPGIEPAPDAGDAECTDCELPELVTRFRHVRAQSAAFLEGLSDEAWGREGRDPVLGPISVARIVTHWVSHDAAAIGHLTVLCAGQQNHPGCS